jgi:hypothetical protein
LTMAPPQLTKACALVLKSEGKCPPYHYGDAGNQANDTLCCTRE